MYPWLWKGNQTKGKLNTSRSRYRFKQMESKSKIAEIGHMTKLF